MFTTLHPIRIVAMDGNQDTSLTDHALVTLGFILGRPIPTKAPTIPPITPPVPMPPGAAMIGPEAMKGPSRA